MLGAEVQEVTDADERPQGPLLIGTEAVLHRVGSASLVVFLDFDQELLAPRYRAGAEGAEKTSGMLHALNLLLEDLLLIHSGVPALIRNTDLAAELARMTQNVTPAWLEAASRGVDQVESGMRRNLLRSLSLDAFAASLPVR